VYIAALVIPVPEGKKDAYRAWAAKSAAFFKEYGCLEVVDSWEDNVPLGKITDFRRAVAADESEKIALSWQIWPSKDVLEAAEERMHADPRMDAIDDIPFDAKRLIVGCFAEL
jgi:uncharacterized protein YbaA (DUF1428 family)